MELLDLPVEILRHIAGDVFSNWDRGSLCLTCKYSNAIVGEFLWRDITMFEGKAKGFFEVLDGPGNYAGWIRTLKFSEGRWFRPDECDYQVETAPNRELCALFAKVLRKMPELQSLEIPMLLCGPAVIAELCAHKESKLQSLCMAIGEMDDTEDLSVLSNLELSTGKLRSLRLLECEQEYPQRFVDAISRIIQASAETIYTLHICSTLYVQQFFKGVKGFPTLLNLDIRDTDLIRLPCFISKARWIRFLTVVCNGNTLDPNTANCVARYFGSFDNLHLFLQTHPYDVEGLMELGPSLIALCANIKILTVEVYAYAEMHEKEQAGDGEPGGEQAENNVEGGVGVVDDNQGVEEDTGAERVAEEADGRSENEANGSVEGAGTVEGNETEVADGEGENHVPLTQVEIERSLVHHWTSHGNLEQVIFWYNQWTREWSRENGSGEWSLNEHTP